MQLNSNAVPTNLSIRFAQPEDAPTLLQLVLALAEYENLTDQVVGSAEALKTHLLGDDRGALKSHPYIEAVLAEYEGQSVGFALFFVDYSTFLTQPGLYLEDLFVLPAYRGQKVGKALLTHLAKLALERNYGRMSWSVLDWNTPAIGFYQRMGAVMLEEVRICRLAGDALLLPQQSSFSPRPATLDDLPALFALARANAEFHHSPNDFVGNMEALGAHVFDNRSHLEAIVVEQAGEVAGFALCFYNYSTFLTKPGLFIEDLFVLSKYRGQGIGKALLSYLARQVIERNCGRLEWLVTTWNQPTIAFYQHLGAEILPDWRICRMRREAIERMAIE